MLLDLRVRVEEQRRQEREEDAGEGRHEDLAPLVREEHRAAPRALPGSLDPK